MNRGANGELSHLQGHENNAFDVTNEDFAGDIQGSACSSFDHVASHVARGGFNRDNFVGVGTHGGRQVLQGESPTVPEHRILILINKLWGLLICRKNQYNLLILM